MRALLAKLDLPVFVPLLGAYPVAYMAGRNTGQFAATTAIGMALVMVLSILVVYAIFRWRSRAKIGAGVAAAFVLVMFFAYPEFVSWARSAAGAGMSVTNALDSTPHLRYAVAIVWAAMAWALGLRIARAGWARRVEVSRALTFASVVLLVLALAPLVLSALHNSMVGEKGSEPVSRKGSGGGRGALPDIYFIVLDGYARGDVLTRYYDFDNSPFLDALQARGFRVAGKSSANYNWTFLSISSTLNLSYLQDLFGESLDPASKDRTATYESIRNSATAGFLRERGYRIVHFQSTYSATASNPFADQEIKCEHQIFDDEFARSLVEATWLSAFATKATVDLAECHLANFRALTRIGSSPGPKFVFAHFVPPHHPYLFDRNGSVLRNATVSNQFEAQKQLWENKQGYVGQLEYLNQLALQAIDGIIEKSSKPPVVVLVSDHGPGLAQGLSSKQAAGVRFANLSAYLLPDAPPNLMPNDVSAVNQFRRILSYYFDASLEPLPDRYFQSPYGRPFDFREVPPAVLRSEWGDSTADAPQIAAVADTASDVDQATRSMHVH